MLKKHLDKNEIYNIAISFRMAIIKAKQNKEFNNKDRMFNFPRGCCDDSCDLLAYYLHDRYQIHAKQVNGVYRDNDFYNTTNHAWLTVNDIIIDITADQFPSLIEYVNGIYVGSDSEFYRQLDDIKFIDNCDIKENFRLWHDYQVILKYISR